MSDIVRGNSPSQDPESVRVLLGNIRDVCIRFNVVSLERQIEAAGNLFAENQLIDVAILGQFKAGKSSFINSLTDEPILPVGVIPVTTVITRLKYGEKERAVVTYFTGGQTVIDLARVEDFISELKNPANERNVEVVDIDLPSLRTVCGPEARGHSWTRKRVQVQYGDVSGMASPGRDGNCRDKLGQTFIRKRSQSHPGTDGLHPESSFAPHQGGPAHQGSAGGGDEVLPNHAQKGVRAGNSPCLCTLR